MSTLTASLAVPELVTKNIPITALVAVSDARPYMQLGTAGTSWGMSKRAESELAELIGMNPSHMHSLALDGMNMHTVVPKNGPRSLYLTIDPGNSLIEALAFAEPKSITTTDMMDAFERTSFNVAQITYRNGIVRTRQLTSEPMQIGGDIYTFGVEVEIDLAGHMSPSASDHLWRQICANGATIEIANGNGRQIPLYDNSEVNASTLVEHLTMWRNLGIPEDVRHRLTVADMTTASIAEVMSLAGLLVKREFAPIHVGVTGRRRQIQTGASQAIEAMLGNVTHRFGVASLDEIPSQVRTTLPSQVSVLGLFNLATELSSHHVPNSQGSETLAGWWNRLLNRTYHLEGRERIAASTPARWIGEPGVMIPTN